PRPRRGRPLRRPPFRWAYMAASAAGIIALVAILYGFHRAAGKEADRLWADAEQMTRQAMEAVQAGERNKARRYFGRARDRYDELIKSPRHLDPLSLRLGRAEVRWRLSFFILLLDPKDWKEAREELDTARSELEGLREEYPDHPKLLWNLAETYHSLGALCSTEQKREKLEEALKYYELAL